jgi:BASS family bile acid:Na+ symporter
MGMSLTVSDFKRVFQTPQYVLIGFLAQYTIMPTAAAALSKIFQLGPELSAGLILVGCAPGGTASNLVSMIAKADLALSVLMTAASTVAAVVMTPFLTSRLAGSYVSIKAADLVTSTLGVVLAPVIAGLGLNTFLPGLCREFSKYTPFLSVLLVSFICGTVAASNSGVKLGVSAVRLIGAIVSLHLSGFLFGYVAAKLLKSGESQARTIR